MMTWSIPAKTFLLGEYIAVRGLPAIVLTTTPCFELSLTETPQLDGIHPASPAGQFWISCAHKNHGLSWCDPYAGLGGFGASSAQFVGAFSAHALLEQRIVDGSSSLEAYWAVAWQGKGIRPSGYDVLAQQSQGCVYIHQALNQQNAYDWCFSDINFILVHTGQKLATHVHLREVVFEKGIDPCVDWVELAHSAFQSANSSNLIEAINGYYDQLNRMNLVAEHTQNHVDECRHHPDVLAVKGCGAMGADVLLLIVSNEKTESICQWLFDKQLNVVATARDLFKGPSCFHYCDQFGCASSRK